MALVVKDRVQETSTTTGTGTFTLGGATSGFQSFSVIGNGNTTYYAIVGGTEWEVGLGTYTSSGTTLSRDTILESSNGGTAVNFSAGTKNVFVTYPAEKSLYFDASGNVGINTNSPSTRLTVGRVDSSNEGGQIDLCRSSDNASSWAIDVFGNTSTPSLRFVDNIAGSARVTIDSTGVMSVPKGISGTPAFSAYQGTTQTINDNTDTKLTINTEDFDTNSNFDTSTYRFTPNVAGYYQIQGAIYFNNQSAYSTVKLFKNGTAVNLGPQNGNGAFTYGSNVSAVIYFNGSTDYIELYGYQNSGVSRTTVAGRPYTYFSGALLRAA